MKIYSVYHTPDGNVVVSYVCTQEELAKIASGEIPSKPSDFFNSAESLRDKQVAKQMTRATTLPTEPVNLS